MFNWFNSDWNTKSQSYSLLASQFVRFLSVLRFAKHVDTKSCPWSNFIRRLSKLGRQYLPWKKIDCGRGWIKLERTKSVHNNMEIHPLLFPFNKIGIINPWTGEQIKINDDQDDSSTQDGKFLILLSPFLTSLSCWSLLCLFVLLLLLYTH